ncbi:MAG: hypothetical protein FJX18_07065 [Alphaproteobacteria bacterium]|nr:hypothetical protein [Alphaproteobacteria bacterium]
MSASRKNLSIVKIYLVNHDHVFPHGQTCSQLIGMAASLEEAEAVVEKYKKLPGFCEQPDNFFIKEFEVDKDKYTEKP